MNLRKLCKQNGTRCMYNNWGKAVAIVLLLIATSLLFTLLELVINLLLSAPPIVDPQYDGWYLNNIPSTTILAMTLTSIMTIGSFLIMAPLKMGVISWYYGVSEGDSPEILSIFNYFSSRRYFRALNLEIHLLGRKILWALIYFALPAAIAGASAWLLNYGAFYMDLNLGYAIGVCGLVFSLMLALLMAVLYAIHIQKYFLAEYYVVNMDCGIWEALKKSRHASRGKRGEILLFRLSFLPWYLLCAVVIPALYVLPYYNISAMLYARVLMEQHYRSTQLVPVEKPAESDVDATQIFDAVNPEE